jgi:hypothetical protein
MRASARFTLTMLETTVGEVNAQFRRARPPTSSAVRGENAPLYVDTLHTASRTFCDFLLTTFSPAVYCALRFGGSWFGLLGADHPQIDHDTGPGFIEKLKGTRRGIAETDPQRCCFLFFASRPGRSEDFAG